MTRTPDEHVPHEPPSPPDGQADAQAGQEPPSPPHPHAAAHMPPPWWAQPPRKRSAIGRILVSFGALVFFVSIVMNGYLMAILAATTSEDRMVTSVAREGQEEQTVAVYEVSGVLTDVSADRFARFYHEVAEDPNIQAVVLRVESPGGGITASDQIHRYVKMLAESKTVVVSMGAVAASGGYYISAPADEIYAEPTTLTGSIGVIMSWVVVEGTLEEIGMEAVTLKSTSARGWKDELSPFRRPNDVQRQHLQAVLDKMQARFDTVVREGREGKLVTKDIRQTMTFKTDNGPQTVSFTETAPLNGKIYLADEALDYKLIDTIGYLDQAIERAISLAGLDNPNVVRYSVPKPLLEQLTGAEHNGKTLLHAETIEDLQTPKIQFLWKAQ